MTLNLHKCLFEILYQNRHLYWFASTVPFAGEWRMWQRLVLSRLSGHNILELGCGLGDLLADMIEEGYNCQAIEKSSEMVAAARSNLQRKHFGDPDCITQGQAQDLSFPDASFDTVVSTFPNEYIYDPNTISEVKRVLRPGGRLIVIIGANTLSISPIQRLLLPIKNFIASIQGNKCTQENTITEIIHNDWFEKNIPLEQHGLRRRCERVRSRDWEVYIVWGDKQ